MSDILDQIQQRHGNVVAVSIGGQIFACRCPTGPEYARVVNALTDSSAGKKKQADRYAALKGLVVSTLVHPEDDGAPDRAALNEALHARPGAVSTLADGVMGLADEGVELLGN